jgi:hypothetical protein
LPVRKGACLKEMNTLVIPRRIGSHKSCCAASKILTTCVVHDVYARYENNQSLTLRLFDREKKAALLRAGSAAFLRIRVSQEIRLHAGQARLN